MNATDNCIAMALRAALMSFVDMKRCTDTWSPADVHTRKRNTHTIEPTTVTLVDGSRLKIGCLSQTSDCHSVGNHAKPPSFQVIVPITSRAPQYRSRDWSMSVITTARSPPTEVYVIAKTAVAATIQGTICSPAPIMIASALAVMWISSDIQTSRNARNIPAPSRRTLRPRRCSSNS